MEYSDVIYGCFTIPDDISSIIATPVFQRLKYIKQVGLLYKIIPTATHTRYEHCIGTYHRARMMLDRLEKNTSWITAIPTVYRKAVEIAALLHDVGHGPFSHAWEHIGVDYHHEQNALPCIDAIFETLDRFEDLHADQNFGIELIKALILGDNQLLTRPLNMKYRFIFEIVSNKQCKLDVDKWDYLKRDHYHLSAFLKEADCHLNMNIDSVFLEARASANGAHVEYRFEDYDKIHALFEARFELHFNCYRMAKNKAYDQVIAEIIQNLLQERINGKKLTGIQANNMPEFLELTDDKIFRLIEADESNKWMLDINNIEAIDIDQPTQDIPNYLRVRESFKTAGSEMPADDEFHFYGDERDMKIIKCNRGLLVRENFFRFRFTRPLNDCQTDL